MKYHLLGLAVNSTWHIVVQQSIVAGCDIYHMPANPARRSPRQEDLKFKDNLG